MRSLRILIAAALLALPAQAGEPTMLSEIDTILRGIESKIQSQLLDPILGPGRGFAFVDAQFEVQRIQRENSKNGTGYAVKKDFDAPKAQEPADLLEPSSGSEKGQVSKQSKTNSENVRRYRLVPQDFSVRIVHARSVPEDELAELKRVLSQAYADSLKLEDIAFVPARFDKG